MFKKFITIVIAAGAAAAYYLLKNDNGNSTTQVPSDSKPLPKEEKKAEKTEAVVSYEEKEPVEEVQEEPVKEETTAKAEVKEEVTEETAQEEAVQEETVTEEASDFDALVNDLDAALAELKEKNAPAGPFTEEKEEVKEEEPVKTEVLPEELEVIEVPEAEDIFEEIASRVENKEEAPAEVTEEEPILEEKRALSREEEIRRLLNDEDDEVEDTYVEEPLQRSAKNKPEEQNKSGNSRKLLELQVDLVMANYPDDYVFLLQHHILPNRNLEKLEADIKGREYAIVYSDEGITAQKVIIQRNREIKDEILTMAEVAKKYGAVYRGFNVIPQ